MKPYSSEAFNKTLSLNSFQIPVEGTAPEARHSHSASSYRGGAVLFGGLGKGDAPLGDTVILRPNEQGFYWDAIQVHPCVVPRCVAFRGSRSCI